MKTDFDNNLGNINYFNYNRREILSREIEKHEKNLHKILAICRQIKLER